MNEDLIPIIVGVGQINDRSSDPEVGLTPIELMIAALRAAEHDAGSGILDAADYIGVVQQISFPEITDNAFPLATAISAHQAAIVRSDGPNGDSPIKLLNDAANKIGAGEISIALVVGAEALRTAAARAASTHGRKLDHTREVASRHKPGYAQNYGLVAPVDVYPLYENALRKEIGQTLAEAQAETGALWSLFSKVATGNQHAWLRKTLTPAEVTTPSEINRPIAFPYTKLQVANSSVNQGAGFIIMSTGEARRRAIPQSKWIYVGNGAAAHEAKNVLKRDSYSRSASMKVSIQRALQLNGISPPELDLVELYSCFPCIPKLARRVIDWPVERAATVFGGLTFGGGPIGNYMSHAIACMVEDLRRSPGNGLLFANGGFATYNHSIVISSTPIKSARFPKSYDYQLEADQLREQIPELDKEYVGPASVETFTVHYRRDGSIRSGVIIARTPQGYRTLAHVPGADLSAISYLTAEASPIGLSGQIIEGDPLRVWRFS